MKKNFNWLITLIALSSMIFLEMIGFDTVSRPSKAQEPSLAVPSDSSSMSAASTGTPNIVMEKTEHNFGRLLSGTDSTTSFQFKNTGNGELHIKRVSGS